MALRSLPGSDVSLSQQTQAIYRDDTDRFHFLELLAEMVERYSVEVHAYVLMDNHFHLLLQTPEPTSAGLSNGSTSVTACV